MNEPRHIKAIDYFLKFDARFTIEDQGALIPELVLSPDRAAILDAIASVELPQVKVYLPREECAGYKAGYRYLFTFAVVPCLQPDETITDYTLPQASHPLESAERWRVVAVEAFETLIMDDQINVDPADYRGNDYGLDDAPEEPETVEIGSCPHCRSKQITGGFVEILDGLAQQECRCDDCGTTWDDIYQHIAVDNIETPERERPSLREVAQ